MARTTDELVRGTFLRLNEALNSPFANLEYGSGNTAYQGSTATVVGYLNDGMRQLAQTCVLIPGFGTKALATGAGFIDLHDMASQMERSPAADGSVLWAATDVLYGGTALMFAGQEDVRARFPASIAAVAASTPFFWWRDGELTVGVWPPPAFTATLAARGYVVPPTLTAHSTASWLPDYAAPALEMFAAIRLAEQSYDDPSLYERLGHLVPDYESARLELYARIPESIALDLRLVPPGAAAQGPARRKR